MRQPFRLPSRDEVRREVSREVWKQATMDARFVTVRREDLAAVTRLVDRMTDDIMARLQEEAAASGGDK
jgi:hypothetical protein